MFDLALIFLAIKSNKMTSYGKLRTATERMLTMIKSNERIPAELRGDIKAVLSLIDLGGEEKIIDIIGYFAYVLRKRIEVKDEEYFKSKDFERKITKALRDRGLLEELPPGGIGRAFSFASTRDDSIFNEEEQKRIYGYINVLIDNYPKYVAERRG